MKQQGPRHVWVKCKECKTRFLARVANRRRGCGRFCSNSCATIHQNKARPKKGRTKLTNKERYARYGRRAKITGIVGRVRGRAKQKSVPCELTPTLFKQMWAEQKGRCAYTGRKMLIGKDTRQSWHLDSVSVDRVSPKKGYVVGNMKLCCRWVNSAKGQSTIRALLYRAEALLHYSARRREI